VRFPVFSYGLSGVYPAKIDIQGVEHPPYFLVLTSLRPLHLALGEALEEAAAGLTALIGSPVQALQKLVGD